ETLRVGPLVLIGRAGECRKKYERAATLGKGGNVNGPMLVDCLQYGLKQPVAVLDMVMHRAGVVALRLLHHLAQRHLREPPLGAERDRRKDQLLLCRSSSVSSRSRAPRWSLPRNLCLARDRLRHIT